MLEIKGNGKILVFSDIHFGKSRDSHLKLEMCSEAIDWICHVIKENQIKTIFFLGDYFNNRSHLNILTLNKAYEALQRLTSLATVYFLVGNHDLYLKTGTEIHSLAQFEALNNFYFINYPTEVNLPFNRTALMCPWHSELDKYKEKEYDYIFGHLEPTGILMSDTEVSQGRYSMKDLVDLSPRVFSGHFHNHKEYNETNGTVYMVGNPLQMDWGDYNNDKGVYIIDLKTNSIQFIKNTVSSIYIKYYYSKIIDKTQKVSNDCTNNIVKLIIDCEYSYPQIAKLIDEIKSFNPKYLDSPDFIFSVSKNLLAGLKFDNKLEDLSMTKFQYLKQFIENMNISEDINKVELINLLKGYYEKCEADDKPQVDE